ncbi:hypothetical protein L1049_006471 [Liquidambar formosana]|uniref:Uncharacterized protein n=1 Tax=Liquidambar formosana TaxID=63359 RepID=A0AAP0RH84_LIQFO
MKLWAEMEQQYNNSDSSNNREDDGYLGLPIHSQVRKIKQEFEKIKHPSLQQPEMRRVLRDNNRRQRSRSPLGLAERPISV